MKIGVFDSGMGGITVLTELQKRLPHWDYVYLGDTANVPYGTKSAAQVRLLSTNCAELLKAKNVDALVVACNTASSLALDAIREVMGDIPALGMVEPGVSAVMSAHDKLAIPEAPVLVLATRATIKSGTYGRLLREQIAARALKAAVIEQACPLLVPIIEEGWLDHPILHQTIAEYVSPYAKRFSTGVALLGCTHYPWIQGVFEKYLPGWVVVNSAEAVLHYLESSGIPLGRAPLLPVKSGTEWIFTDMGAIPGFAQRMIDLSSGKSGGAPELDGQVGE